MLEPSQLFETAERWGQWVLRDIDGGHAHSQRRTAVTTLRCHCRAERFRTRRMQFERGRKTSLLAAVWHGAWTFFRTYVLRAGFLDGREGFMLAVSNAEGAYYRYLKLLLLTEKKLRR